jgi:hypothetical protein
MSKAKSETQLFRLFDLLSKAGETGVPKSEIVSKLGVKESSVPVYIHSLKKKFKAEISNKTEGRVVVGYVLTNQPSVPQFKRAAAPASKSTVSTAGGETPVLDTDVTTEYSEREVADISSALGVGGYGQDY